MPGARRRRLSIRVLTVVAVLPLPIARQIAVRESWLPRRDDMLLRMMRARKTGMWLVVPAAAGRTRRVRDTGRLLDGRLTASAEDEGRPVPGTAARPFSYVVGTSRLNPALDEALGSMRAGERRFVIAPNTTLVNEIEVPAIVR